MKCNNREDNKCLINNNTCPWVYWCDKVNGYKWLKNAPEECNLMPKAEDKNVLFERRGYLYVEYKGEVVKVKNIFNYIPIKVSVVKGRNGKYRIKGDKNG